MRECTVGRACVSVRRVGNGTADAMIHYSRNITQIKHRNWSNIDEGSGGNCVDFDKREDRARRHATGNCTPTNARLLSPFSNTSKSTQLSTHHTTMLASAHRLDNVVILFECVSFPQQAPVNTTGRRRRNRHLPEHRAVSHSPRLHSFLALIIIDRYSRSGRRAEHRG